MLNINHIDTGAAMIKWNKKVPQNIIARLYNHSAAGIKDDDLADEVGCALYARCQSIIAVTKGYEKKLLPCPLCENEIPLVNDVFTCKCGFSASWDDFRKSYKNKQLYAANALPIFIDYVNKFPKAKSYGEKIICIDCLIHSFHIRNSFHHVMNHCDINDPETEINRPTGANLIEGTLSQVIIFLNELSSIEGYSRGKSLWLKNVKRANGGYI